MQLIAFFLLRALAPFPRCFTEEIKTSTFTNLNNLYFSGCGFRLYKRTFGKVRFSFVIFSDISGVYARGSWSLEFKSLSSNTERK